MTSEDMKQELTRRAADMLDKYAEHIGHWVFKISKLPFRTNGSAYYYRKIIKLNEALVIPGNDIERLWETCLHEFAHAMAFETTGRCGHRDEAFVKWCRKFGCSPKAGQTSNLIRPSKYKVICKGCGQTSQYQRMGQRRRDEFAAEIYICKLCGCRKFEIKGG